ncbi:hypothetical protein [Marinobacter psychrophilus]|uniref:hypothetical protein n=1 Tax=Marinobacter psychrophilus TaxID=330734 RepID=UPI002357DEE9|nr:hypothetical protein [Marinobacter psychrophilus]
MKPTNNDTINLGNPNTVTASFEKRIKVTLNFGQSACFGRKTACQAHNVNFIPSNRWSNDHVCLDALIYNANVQLPVC